MIKMKKIILLFKKQQPIKIIIIVMVLCLFQSYKCMAQPKASPFKISEVNIAEIVKTTLKANESVFEMEALTEKEVKDKESNNPDISSDSGFTVGGKLKVATDPITGNKRLLETGYYKGYGAEVSLDSEGNTNASFEKEVDGTKIKITIKGNVTGEFSNAEVFYNEGDNAGDTSIKIIGDAQGKISVEAGYTYDGNSVDGAWTGKISFTTNNGDAPIIKLSDNFKYETDSADSITGGKLTFSSSVSAELNFSNIEDSTFYWNFFNLSY